MSNGIEQRPSISQHSSISQADDSFSPYERVKYDKIKAKEHPYAQVQPTTSRQIVYEENLPSNSEERATLLRFIQFLIVFEYFYYCFPLLELIVRVPLMSQWLQFVLGVPPDTVVTH